MAASKEYLDYILEQFNDPDRISYRMMMGEYILYYKGRIAAYICDDRLLLKPVPAAKRLLPNAPLLSPYEGAKPMLIVQEVDNNELMQRLLEEMYPELPEPKRKK